jgi:AcrR family transcriptional regulator
MKTRAAAMDATHQSIVDAAKELQAQQGMLGTSFEEIAAHAGVAQGTVYRHFPSLDELIPACARTIHVLQPIDPARAAEAVPPLPRPSQRLEWLVRGTCDCYMRDGGWINAVRREEDLISALGEIGRIQRENLRLLVQASLVGQATTSNLVSVVTALIDFPFWKSLRDTGLSGDHVVEQILELVRDQLDKERID